VHPAPVERWSQSYKAEPSPTPVGPTDSTRLLVAAELQEREAPPERTPALGDTDPEMAIVTAEDVPDDATLQVPEPVTSDLPPGYIRCAHCHAVLPPDTRLCPVCGQLN
jgi:hypothetical protein